MNAKQILGLVFVTAILLAVVALVIGRKTETVVVAQQTPPPKSPVVVESIPPAPVPAPEIQPSQTPAPPAATPQKSATQILQPAPQNQKEPLHDPDARVALSFVGTGDPDAEAYWLSAIFDTSLPDGEREDLMEDLNEDGFADPKHPSADEIPLILNRLALIEQIAPSADDFMLEHLGEAYKDLNNMLAGKPVQ